jgi:hypothetical protein
METEERTEGISRRRMLKRIGAGAAVAWSAPILTSIKTPAFAQASPRCPCDTNMPCNIKIDCGPGGACYCWVNAAGNGCFCGEGNPCTGVPCDQNNQCPNNPGWACVNNCCGLQCWPPCGGPRTGARKGARGTGTR